MKYYFAYIYIYNMMCGYHFTVELGEGEASYSVNFYLRSYSFPNTKWIFLDITK